MNTCQRSSTMLKWASSQRYRGAHHIKSVTVTCHVNMPEGTNSTAEDRTVSLGAEDASDKETKPSKQNTHSFMTGGGEDGVR